MEDAAVEDRLYGTFEKHDDFAAAQSKFLGLCNKALTNDEETEADVLMRKLSMILNEYQEQAYLLDPFLERLVGPVVEHFKLSVSNVSPSQISQGTQNIARVAYLLYSYVTFRGHKTITRFFPHEINDLSIALNFLLANKNISQDQDRWSLRYVMLLWLSLICRLPFDLAQFDEPETLGKTTSDLEAVAKINLDRAGVEREGAATLLSRLYARHDTNTMFPAFLQWITEALKKPDQLFLSIGGLQVICELVKSGSTNQVVPHTASLLEIAATVDANKTLMSNTLVRKYRIKLVSRVLLRLLPPRRVLPGRRGKTLLSTIEQPILDEDEDIDIPDELEDTLGGLLDALQDKDTVVRYSAAKAVARISERLPPDFVEQVLQQVLQLFTIHSLGAATLYDMPSIAESTWHGASLACAEMARRGLIADSRLQELIDWMRKALFFDIRKGAHSVGASVRDAASYVLWSLARAQSVSGLAPFADGLARTLVTVAVFDREVHIRRAASAAFQEFVGRTSLFPHGIDVLRKTDFYAVGTRRNAFLVAAAEVAEHEVYRDALTHHLLTVTLRHWDPAMRRLGAQSLSRICQIDIWTLGPTCVDQAAQFVDSADTGDIHGALWVLAELAAAYKSAGPEDRARPYLRKIFGYLSKLSPSIVQSFRNELVTAAACEVIANSISREDVNATGKAQPQWQNIVDFSLKTSIPVVQDAVANAMAAISKLVDCSSYVQSTFIREAKAGSPAAQQNACRVLGVLDYSAHPHGLLPAVRFLLSSVDKPNGLKNVEARRNAYNSIPQILANVVARIHENIPAETVNALFDALLAGLEDYTTDERGDVGSWIRIACVKGLAATIELLIAHAHSIPSFDQYLPPEKYHAAIAGILKQGVERLDNVRQQAGEQLLRLLAVPAPDVPQAKRWAIRGEKRMRELLMCAGEEVDWNDGSRLFPRVVQLLAIPEYRQSTLSGLVLSASSRTDSTQRPVSQSLVAYAQTLPVHSADSEYDLCGLASDLLVQVKGNLGSNNTVIPVLQTFNVLLEADALEPLFDDAEGLKSLQYLLSISSRGVAKFKSVQRIAASMRIVANLLCVPRLRNDCAAQLAVFLGHQYPKVRTDTAEYLYVVLQSKDLGCDTEEAEEVLLETEWSAGDTSAASAEAERCARLLSMSDG